MRYPVLLVHGVACRDNPKINYWGRIPKHLRQLGVDVFFGNQDGYGSVEDNAAFLKNRVEEILRETGAEKVNIIAHSKGGLDCRYMIGKLDMGDRVASLTTLCTPHHGSRTMDALLRMPRWMIRTVSYFCNIWYRFLGDKHPDAYHVFCQFSTRYAQEFNQNIPEDERVFCQSYAFVMKKATSDFIMWLPYLVVKKMEGENDGLVTPHSAEWAEFRGVFSSGTNRGISHMDVVDIRRMSLSKKKGKGGMGDIRLFYEGLIRELSEKGF